MTNTLATTRAKSYDFPATVEWLAGRTVLVSVDGKQHVAVGPPLEFGGTDPVVWSPEDLLVAAAASCLAVTFTGLAQRGGVHVSSMRVDGEGTVGTRRDGRFGFTDLKLHLRIVAPPADADRVALLAAEAEERCLVASSLALPVHVEIDVHSAGE